MIRRTGLVVVSLVASSSTVLAGCAASPPDPITNGHLSAAIAGGVTVHGAMLNHGSFVVVGNGCLGLEEVFLFEVAEGEYPRTYVAALPPGSTITADDAIVFPDGTEVGLGDVFPYDIGGWGPWDPATESEPSTEIAIPEGCPAGLPTVAVIPLTD